MRINMFARPGSKWILVILCLLLAPAQSFSAHGPSNDNHVSWLATKNVAATPRPECSVTDNCVQRGNQPSRTTCRLNGPCIPTSWAWSVNGPLATNSGKPGGFIPAENPPPIPVPGPAPLVLLCSALFGLRLVSRRHHRRRTK